MEEKGLKTSDLSRITGIPYTTLSEFIRGKKNKFDIQKTKEICNALGCSLDYLLDDECNVVKEDKAMYYLDKEAAQYAQMIANKIKIKGDGNYEENNKNYVRGI